ncbi:MAG: CDP-diacylglycerol--glycerol-3-phosphate 3-phosphatidyltransferase [Gammaproteobacteria bacterium]|nr:CDP-diacylglycerol--glycerol-3-phosphate 3-phosphatidyltransferase [Gammaproteobacteria bacterium]
MNLPNFLTFLRIMLVPVLVLSLMLPWSWSHWVSAGVFGFAGLTDWLDGYLARRLGKLTRFGAFLDPVADKLIVVSALVMMVGAHASVWFSLAAVVIVGREIMISALREWMAEMQRRGLVAVSWVGKVKTTFQMIAIFVLLANPADPGVVWVQLGYGLLAIAVVLTLWSMVVYIQAAWPTLREAYQEASD